MIFTDPDASLGGAPGDPGSTGAGVYGSIMAVFLFSGTVQAFTAGMEQKIVSFGTNVVSAGVTADQAGDRLVILEDGIYDVFWMQSYLGNVAWVFNFIELRANGILVPNLSLTDYEGSAFKASCSSAGAVQFSAGDVLELYAETSANVSITWYDADFSAWKVRS